jgi:hypothetical protein
MTLSTLIIVNAVLAAAAAYGIVMLLAHGIRSDRFRHLEAEIRALRHRDVDRLAA